MLSIVHGSGRPFLRPHVGKLYFSANGLNKGLGTQARSLPTTTNATCIWFSHKQLFFQKTF